MILAVATLDTAVWSFTCARIERDASGAFAPGWSLSAAHSNWAGWPVAAEVRFTGASVRGDATVFPPGLAWDAAAVRLRIGITRPRSLLVLTEGPQTAAAEGIGPIDFAARRIAAVIDLTGRDPAQVSVDQLDAATPAGPLRIDAASLQLGADAFIINASAISLPGGHDHASLPPIDAVQLRAAASRRFPSAPSPEASARAWRDAGGRIELSGIGLRWGALTAAAQASVALDPQLQPVAEGSIEAAGLPQFLDALVQAGVLARTQATAAKAVIAILAAPSAGGPVRLPVTLHDGILSVARYPLLRLPPLAWN